LPEDKASGNNEKKSEVRRDFIKALIALGLVTVVSPQVIAEIEKKPEGLTGDDWYEPFDISDDPKRQEQYEESAKLQLGYSLVIEKDGKKLVANPLLPEKPITYMVKYEKDKFRLPPPGAKDLFARCIRCGLCASACASMGYHAIRLGDFKDGYVMLGVPIVDNQIEYPCTLCMECTKVCPTGALEEIPQREVKMGIALIDPDLCWAWNTGECYSCAKACPFGTEVFAFRFNEWGAHTRVLPDKCNGCGMCVQACPVVGSAIHVLPPEEYERRTKNFKNTGMSYEEYIKFIWETEDSLYTDPMAALKLTWRVNVNVDYIVNERGLIESKVKKSM